jgi:hypothetical protein
MKTFSRVAIAALTMLGVVGVASAQPKAPAPKAADKAPAPKLPVMPPPPAELAALAKSLAGTWRCKGEEWDSMSGGRGPLTATSTAKLELDKWWLTETMEARGRMTFKMIAHTTYDPAAKKWRRVAVMNDGGYMIGTSEGTKDGKMMWSLDFVGPMGAGMFRDYVEMADPRAGMKAWGEVSMDKGRTWLKSYEMTCKK